MDICKRPLPDEFLCDRQSHSFLLKTVCMSGTGTYSANQCPELDELSERDSIEETVVGKKSHTLCMYILYSGQDGAADLV